MTHLNLPQAELKALNDLYEDQTHLLYPLTKVMTNGAILSNRKKHEVLRQVPLELKAKSVYKETYNLPK